MLKELEELLKETLEVENIKLIKKKNMRLGNYTGYKKVHIFEDYVLLYKGNINHVKLYPIINVLRKIFKKSSYYQKKVIKLNILEKDLEIIMKSNEIFFSKDGILKDFFLFIKGNKFALVEKDKVVINENLDEFTLKSSIGKLEKVNEFSMQVKEGELYGYRYNFYKIVVYKEKGEIDPFIKVFLKSRLMWLNKLFCERNKYMIDEMTGLYVRKKFYIDIKKNYGKTGVFINIKNFKNINEIYGTDFGDEVIKTISSLFEGKGESSYRIYGDKFCIIFNNINNAMDFTKSFFSSLKKGLSVYHKKLSEYFNIRLEIIGLIIKKIDKNSIENFLSSLEKISLLNKNIIVFEEDILKNIEQDKKIFNIINNCIKMNNVVPAFQKVVNIKERNKILYYESLMRIIDGKKIYNPSHFLPIAKKRGIYTKLNEIMMERSFQIAQKEKFNLSINIDLADILRSDFFEILIKTTEKTGINPENVYLELTETEDLYEVFSKKKNLFYEISNLGFSFVIDDFGTGYSNFAYLLEFPVKILKIDGTLIKKVCVDKRNRMLVENINKTAKDLGIETVAEYISSKKILDCVKDIGINYGQGFYISKPKFIT